MAENACLRISSYLERQLLKLSTHLQQELGLREKELAPWLKRRRQLGLRLRRGLKATRKPERQ